MSEGIRRIFYDKATGNKIHENGWQGAFILPTIEQDIATFTALSERNRDTFDVLELEYGEYAQDFAECNGYGVNVEKLASLTEENRHEALEFSYRDPNAPTEPQPYQKPLTTQIQELKSENLATMEALADVYEMMLGGGL